MKPNSKNIFYVLIFSGVIIIPITILFSQETDDVETIHITEDAVFDPLCLVNDHSDTVIDKMCVQWRNSWFLEIGASTNFPPIHTDNIAKSAFFKINLPQEIFSNPLQTTKITNADMVIGGLYDSINFTQIAKERFTVTYGSCNNIGWSKTTSSSELPCINKYGYPELEIDSFHGVIEPHRITTLKIDIKSHLDNAIKNNKKSFTEIIQLYPTSFVENSELRQETTRCVESSTTEETRNNCVDSSKIWIYRSTYPSLGFKPQITVEFHKEPTFIMQSINTVVFTIYGILGSFVIYLRGQENDFKEKMIRVCESIKKEVEDAKIGLTIGVEDVKPTKQISINYHKDYDPIVFDLTSEISEVVLFINAFQGVLNSGSFENFTKEHQIEITSLYYEINQYNETVELFYKTIENSRFTFASKSDIKQLYWALQVNLGHYLQTLAEIRIRILNKIDEPNNGILKILDDEIGRYK